MASLFNSTAIPVLEQVVGFTQARHGVLAGNIANIDVPGYQSRDLSPELFEERLKSAIQTRDRGPISRSPGEGFKEFQGVKDSFRSILYHDQGDVSLENQVAEITKNQARHNLALTIMVSQFRLLQAAVSERV